MAELHDGQRHHLPAHGRLHLAVKRHCQTHQPHAGEWRSHPPRAVRPTAEVLGRGPARLRLRQEPLAAQGHRQQDPARPVDRPPHRRLQPPRLWLRRLQDGHQEARPPQEDGPGRPRRRHARLRSNVKMWRLLNSETGKIRLLRNVRFLEDRYSFARLDSGGQLNSAPPSVCPVGTPSHKVRSIRSLLRRLLLALRPSRLIPLPLGPRPCTHQGLPRRTALPRSRSRTQATRTPTTPKAVGAAAATTSYSSVRHHQRPAPFARCISRRCKFPSLSFRRRLSVQQAS